MVFFSITTSPLPPAFALAFASLAAWLNLSFLIAPQIFFLAPFAVISRRPSMSSSSSSYSSDPSTLAFLKLDTYFFWFRDSVSHRPTLFTVQENTGTPMRLAGMLAMTGLGRDGGD